MWTRPATETGPVGNPPQTKKKENSIKQDIKQLKTKWHEESKRQDEHTHTHTNTHTHTYIHTESRQVIQ